MSVVIVGGGLMGLSAAFHLRRADSALAVTVLERARVGSAASGASAAGVRAMGRGFALAPAVGDVLARLALGRDALLPLWCDLRFDRPALAGS